MRESELTENADSIIVRAVWQEIDIVKENGRINDYGEITLNR